MSRDAHITSLHLHAPHHADLFEEFCRPPSLSTSSSTQNQPPSLSSHNPPTAQQHSTTADNNNTNSAMVSLPGHFLPFEEIPLPTDLMPLNPEDEDGVVPDMHAAFGIIRALGPGGAEGAGGHGEESRAGVQRGEEAWRDLGLEGMLNGGVSSGEGTTGGGGGLGAGGRVQRVGDVQMGQQRGLGGVRRREGQRRGMLLMR